MTLANCHQPLAQAHDVALLDLDGVVYVGSQAVPAAIGALASARTLGMRLAFVTNNAARPPAVVAQHLTELGVAASAEEVITSAQTAAHYLADRLPAGAKVLVVGTVGLTEALAERGLNPVDRADDDVAAMVQGYSPELNWRQLAEGAIAIGRGLTWVATNADPTVPSPRGPLPGNGSLVAALRYATGAEPVVTGKPDPTMHRESVQRSGAVNPIVVGDRLDTDIEGANAVGCASLLVFTGVTAPVDLLAAPPTQRPTYIAPDLAGLLRPHLAASISDGEVSCGAWTVRTSSDGSLELKSSEPHSAAGAAAPSAQSPAPSSGDDLDALRALCAAAWRVVARAPRAPRAPRAAGADPAAAAEIDRLGLGSV
jgi:HAD superfamily hydrolase (TIGR01450 family)